MVLLSLSGEILAWRLLSELFIENKFYICAVLKPFPLPQVALPANMTTDQRKLPQENLPRGKPWPWL
jgi:hypothetical protein